MHALAGGLPTLVIHPAAGAAIAQAPELVKQAEQLVATLDHERLRKHQHQQVPPRGLKPPQLLGGHSTSHRLWRATLRGRQPGHVDLRGAEGDQSAVAVDLAQANLSFDASPSRGPLRALASWTATQTDSAIAGRACR
ncbi:MAG: hypothetical protein ACLPTJ_12515 [Solirubrobacteraceae bacterium]